MKIAFFELEEKDRSFVEERLKGHELSFHTEPLKVDQIENFKDVEVISTRSLSKFTKDMLSQIPDLQLIATRTTGTDHIDTSYCQERGITVSNVPGYGKYTVAEHTIALLLCLSRNLYPSIVRTKNGEFSSRGLTGFELHGKTLGVVGVGSIGKAVIRIAKALGMHVIAYTKDEDPQDAENVGYKYVSFETVLGESDVISMHVPYLPATHHMIHRENLSRIRKGAILINTARGAVVSTDAIIEGLESGIFSGVGLDVLENEHELSEKEKKLLAMDQVIVTPHNAFNSHEALRRILSITVRNIVAFVNGKPENVI